MYDEGAREVHEDPEKESAAPRKYPLTDDDWTLIFKITR